MAKAKQLKDNTYQTSIRLPIELYEEITKLAEASYRTNADQIRFMLAEYLRIKKG